jgi:hypothetical protein
MIKFNTLEPRGIKTEKSKTTLKISSPGKASAAYILLTLSCLTMILGAWTVLLIETNLDSYWLIIASGIFIILSALTVCLILYLFLGQVFNRTVIKVTPNKLMAVQRPFPLGRKQRHAICDISTVQIFTSRYIATHSSGEIFGIELITNQGKKHCLATGFRRTVEPTFIIEEIENFLSTVS